jgi:hypothetical protein
MVEKTRNQEAGGVTERSARDEESEQAVERASAGHPQTDATLPGQLTQDDRGNVSWEWADDADLRRDKVVGNTARLRALAPRNLSIDDRDDKDFATVARKPVPVKKKPQGYNPYDSGEPTKQRWKKKRDLREFGKWVALKKRLGGKSGED